MVSHPSRRPTLQECACTGLRPFLADKGGATAVEFSLIALPLTGLIFVIFEIALMFWMGHALDNAVEVGARKISNNTMPPRTAAAGSTPSDAVRAEICANVGGLLPCDRVKVDLRTFTTLGTASVTQPVDPSTQDWRGGFGTTYECPRDGAIVVLQAAFEFIGFSSLSLGQTELANGNRVIQSAFTFRMENGLGLPAQCGAK
ncbi:TadE/TadG family type IV pilus assembly protein [Methylobacterium iners]|uniref:TadE-like domain-containing protein n=1 Tax=Methylobacterium iners TaxID=418707 RepID=A0ABQ4S380_9HYPH|nr:TadE/TadG family type IV pilus assembly protein [Methylobacterium iners]GJD96862.1 hypothetical protein OCOJLMKI_4088 [Methylobacterium iners]